LRLCACLFPQAYEREFDSHLDWNIQDSLDDSALFEDCGAAAALAALMLVAKASFLVRSNTATSTSVAFKAALAALGASGAVQQLEMAVLEAFPRDESLIERKLTGWLRGSDADALIGLVMAYDITVEGEEVSFERKT